MRNVGDRGEPSVPFMNKYSLRFDFKEERYTHKYFNFWDVLVELGGILFLVS